MVVPSFLGYDHRRAFGRSEYFRNPAMKTLYKTIIIFALAGCISQHQLRTTLHARIPVGSAVGVQTPADGICMGDAYPRSGAIVARKLTSSLLSYYPGSAVGLVGTEYSVRPQILQWEDRATEWSGKPDKVKVALLLYRGNRLIGSALVCGKSSWWTLGGDHPEDLLDLCFEAYSASLAGYKKDEAFER